MDEWLEQEWRNEWWLRHHSYPHLAHYLANGERFRDIFVMHDVPRKSYIKGQLSCGCEGSSKEQESR